MENDERISEKDIWQLSIWCGTASPIGILGPKPILETGRDRILHLLAEDSFEQAVVSIRGWKAEWDAIAQYCLGEFYHVRVAHVGAMLLTPVD